LKISDSVKQDILKHAMYHYTDLATAENELPNFTVTHSGVNQSLLQPGMRTAQRRIGRPAY